ncbi:hypothetical protein QOZ80_2AG0147560 [Eleusine coracana subsp. coracana]|nr:hypothetical protein QOZ80_2AG0147560 [Eleusine coracana subsp. coracana]
MALHSYDCCVFPPQLDWSWDWDLQLHTLGVGGAGDAELQEATFLQAAPRVDSPVSSEASSGYLQDAVAHWNVDSCNKRQRTAAPPPPPPRRPAGVSEDLQLLLESFWDPSTEGEDLSHDLKTTTIPEMSCSFVSEEDVADASGREEQKRVPSTQTQVSAAQGREEAAVPPPRRSNAVRAAAPLQKATTAAAHRDDRFRPGVHCWEPSRAAATTTTTTTMLGASCHSATAGKEKTRAGVLYPFAVIKPLGLDDGCMTTLSDVNQRILKRPARPVRHPVGAFACGSVTAHGLGLSGKAVVSLTKIRTGGKGTITIIRTRG